MEFSARTVPPDGEGGYTEWHRDYGRHNSGPQWQWQFDHPTLSEDVKLFVMVNDQVRIATPLLLLFYFRSFSLFLSLCTCIYIRNFFALCR